MKSKHFLCVSCKFPTRNKQRCNCCCNCCCCCYDYCCNYKITLYNCLSLCLCGVAGGIPITGHHRHRPQSPVAPVRAQGDLRARPSGSRELNSNRNHNHTHTQRDKHTHTQAETVTGKRTNTAIGNTVAQWGEC